VVKNHLGASNSTTSEASEKIGVIVKLLDFLKSFDANLNKFTKCQIVPINLTTDI
jgi:hypothetical protein